MKQFSKYVGMDVHKATVAVSVADADGGEVRYLGEIANTPGRNTRPITGRGRTSPASIRRSPSRTA